MRLLRKNRVTQKNTLPDPTFGEEKRRGVCALCRFIPMAALPMVMLTASMCSSRGTEDASLEILEGTEFRLTDAEDVSEGTDSATAEDAADGGAAEADSSTGTNTDGYPETDAGPAIDEGISPLDASTDSAAELSTNDGENGIDTEDLVPEEATPPAEESFTAPRCGYDCSGQQMEDRRELWAALDHIGLEPYQIEKREYIYDTYNIVVEDFPQLRFSDSDLDRFQSVLRNKSPCVLQGVKKITILPNERSSLCGHFSGSTVMLYAGVLGNTTKCGSMTLDHELDHALDKLVFGNAFYDELFDLAWGPGEMGIETNFPTMYAMENPNELFAETNSEAYARGPSVFLRAVAQAREEAPGVGDILLRILLTAFRVNSVGYTDQVAFEYVANEWAPSVEKVLVPVAWEEGCTGDILQDDIRSVMGIDLYDDTGRPNLEGIESLAVLKAPLTHLDDGDALLLADRFGTSADNELLGVFLEEMFARDGPASSNAIRTFVRYANAYPPALLNQIVSELNAIGPGIDRLDKVALFLGIPEEERYFPEAVQGPLFYWAVDTLYALGGDAAIAALGDLFHALWLSDAEKIHIAGLLGDLGGYAAVEELAYLMGHYFMTNLRNAARDEILKLLADDPTLTTSDLFNTISLLMTIGTTHAADILVSLLFHESEEIRSAAEIAIGTMGPTPVPGLRIALGAPAGAVDDVHNCYGTVARLLGQTASPSNIPALLVSLDTIYPFARQREAFWNEVKTALEASAVETHLLYATVNAPSALGNALALGSPEDPLDSEIRQYLMGLLIPLGGDFRVEERLLDTICDARYSSEERNLALTLFRVRNPAYSLAYGENFLGVGIADGAPTTENPEQNILFWSQAASYLFGHHRSTASEHHSCQAAAVSLLDTGADGLYVRFDIRDNRVEHDDDNPMEGDGVVLILDLNEITEHTCTVGESPENSCFGDAEAAWFPKSDGSGYNVVFHLSLAEEERLSLESGTARINALWIDRTEDQTVYTWLNEPSRERLSQTLHTLL